MPRDITVVQVDFQSDMHKLHLKELLIAYSADLMGGGKPLLDAVATASVNLQASKSYTISFLAYDGEQPVGFANCFENIATFAGLTAMNIHDVAVIVSHRGLGISHKLLDAIEMYARNNGMYKLTLEVLEGNKPAKLSYEKFGFNNYQLDPEMGSAIFLQKIV